MTHEYNPFWQQRIRETVLRALDVHPRLTALRVDLRLPDVPAATDAAVISRFINALKARINAYQKRKRREGKRVHPTTLHYARAGNSGSLKAKTLSPPAAGQPGYRCRAGDYRAPRSLAGMIKQAWCSALGWMPGLMPRWRIFLTRRRCGWNAMMTLAFSRCWNVLTIWRRNIPKLTPLVSATLAAVVAEPDRRVI